MNGPTKEQIVQALIHPPIRERAGNGEIIRDGDHHTCKPPNAALRTVWRCDCGRRWIHGALGWRRRFWPWPR
jgi:hypothetical protein